LKWNDFLAAYQGGNTMRVTFAAFALATTCLSTAFAGDLKAFTKIDAVTVYPQGAEVTRIAAVHLAKGDTTLLLDDLPGEVDAQSLRVEGAGGEGIEIGSVDSKMISTGIDDEAARAGIEKEIEALQDERSALDQAMADAEQQKKLLLVLADRQLTPNPNPEKPTSIDAAQIGSLVDLVAAKLEGVSKAIHQSQLRQRGIDKQILVLQTKLNEVAPQRTAKLQVAVSLFAAAETDGTFTVKYRVANAGWAPFYDARLTGMEREKTPNIELVRRAEVMQNTGEGWNDVALTLSTARTLGATNAPDIMEDEIQVYAPLAERMKGEADGAARKQSLSSPAAPAISDEIGQLAVDKPKIDIAKQRQAVIELAGFQALYNVQGRVSVDNSGTSKKVRISTDMFDGKLEAIAVPKLDAQAYLMASFTAKGDAPMLPGTVNLYRDGVYMGQGTLPLLNAGDEAKLGFGADDLVKVERKEVKRRIGEEGIISSSNIDERLWDISVKNLHKQVMPVRILDQMPFTARDDVMIQMAAQTTPPAEKDYLKRRGVMAWTFDLAPAGAQQITFGYKVTWPKDMQIGMAGD
jgi:uncharacterized protein (TIGR02231 family)